MSDRPSGQLPPVPPQRRTSTSQVISMMLRQRGGSGASEMVMEVPQRSHLQINGFIWFLYDFCMMVDNG